MITRHYGTPDLLIDLDQRCSGGVLHLLSCPRCHRLARACLIDSVPWDASDNAPAPPASEDDYLLAKDLTQFVLAGRKEQANLLAELLALPESEQVQAVNSKPRFLDLDLAHCLIDEARVSTGARSEQLARLALTLALALDRGVEHLSRGTPIAAAAFTLLGRAQVDSGDLEGGAQYFAEAARRLTTDLPLTRAFYLRELAMLYREMERYEEAIAFLEHALRLRREAEDFLEGGGVLAALGLLHLEERGQPAEALPLLSCARRLLAPELFPGVWLRATLASAYALAHVGGRQQARARLEETTDSFFAATYERDIALRFLRARAEAATGLADRALPTFKGFLFESISQADLLSAAEAIAASLPCYEAERLRDSLGRIQEGLRDHPLLAEVLALFDSLLVHEARALRRPERRLYQSLQIYRKLRSLRRKYGLPRSPWDTLKGAEVRVADQP